jgi:hypothetical protein
MGHPFPFSDTETRAPRKGLWALDRGAVLFAGIAVGAVLALSFLTDGKPFASLLATSHAADVQVVQVAAPAAGGCPNEFPFSRRVIGGLRANRPLRIGVFGDSFGEGIAQAAMLHFQKNPDFTVFQFTQEATGFTRYKSLDVAQDARTRFARQPVDIALIDFGANDTQGVFVDGHAAPYMSARWQTIIAGRATSLVSYLQDQGVAVGWVGLPRMRKPEFDGDVQAMNAFYTGLMCKLHVPFVNPVALSEDGHHQFSKELADPVSKLPYTARADDGIHMSVHGYRVIAGPLFKRIETLSAQGDTRATIGARRES